MSLKLENFTGLANSIHDNARIEVTAKTGAEDLRTRGASFLGRIFMNRTGQTDVNRQTLNAFVESVRSARGDRAANFIGSLLGGGDSTAPLTGRLLREALKALNQEETSLDNFALGKIAKLKDGGGDLGALRREFQEKQARGELTWADERVRDMLDLLDDNPSLPQAKLPPPELLNRLTIAADDRKVAEVLAAYLGREITGNTALLRKYLTAMFNELDEKRFQETQLSSHEKVLFGTLYAFCRLDDKKLAARFAGLGEAPVPVDKKETDVKSVSSGKTAPLGGKGVSSGSRTNPGSKVSGTLFNPNIEISGIEAGKAPRLRGTAVDIAKTIRASEVVQGINTCFIMSLVRGLVEKAAGRQHLGSILHEENGTFYIRLKHLEIHPDGPKSDVDMIYDITVTPETLKEYKTCAKCGKLRRHDALTALECALVNFMQLKNIDNGRYVYRALGEAQIVARLLGLKEEVDCFSHNQGQTMQETMRKTLGTIQRQSDPRIVTYRDAGLHFRTFLGLERNQVILGNSMGSSNTKEKEPLTRLVNNFSGSSDNYMTEGGHYLVNVFLLPESK